MKSVAEVLSDNNRELLRTIVVTNPKSIAELARTVGREPSNVARALETMSHFGFVEMERSNNAV